MAAPPLPAWLRTAALLPRNDQDPDSIIQTIAERHSYCSKDINYRYTAQERQCPPIDGRNVAK